MASSEASELPDAKTMSRSSPLQLDWLARGVIEALYYDESPSKHLQRPPLRPVLSRASLACRALYQATRSVCLRSARHAFYPASSGIEWTAQTGALNAKPEWGASYRQLVLVLQSGRYTPDTAADALQKGAGLLSCCTQLAHLTLFLGKGLELLENDEAAERFALGLMPATASLRTVSIVLDSTEGPGKQQLLGVLGILGWMRPPHLQSVTLRGWRDPATSILDGDASYVVPWAHHSTPVELTSVTTHLYLKDCHLSAEAFAFFMRLFGSSLSHILISWSFDVKHYPHSLSSVSFFNEIKPYRVASVTIRDQRPKAPFFVHLCPGDPGYSISTNAKLPINRRIDAPVYISLSLRSLALEMPVADYHADFLTRFATPALEQLSITGYGARKALGVAALQQTGFLAHRTATDLLRAFDSPSFDHLGELSLAGLPWATQAAHVLHTGCKARTVALRIAQCTHFSGACNSSDIRQCDAA